MATRKVPHVVDQYYHIYNRGVDKRNVFLDSYDLSRFFESMTEFNSIQPVGSLYELAFRRQEKRVGNSKIHQLGHPMSKLVDFVAYCLNPNHYHFILTPLVEKGIEKFMQKLGNGFTKYFNEKYDRSGPLFSGAFKSSHINTDHYLQYVSAYVNLNNKIHNLGRNALTLSSWDEYISQRKSFCNNKIVTDQYKTIAGYQRFAEEVASSAADRKKGNEELCSLLID